MSTKHYLIWRRSRNETTREINLLDIPEHQLKYTKIDILLYQCRKWDRLITTNDMLHFIEKEDIRGISVEQEKLVKTFKISQNPLYRRTDSRIDNSNMLDFIHGRCSVLNKTDETDKLLCLDCNLEKDSSSHKLFICPSFDGELRQELIEQMGTEYTSDYKMKVLFTVNNDLRKSFRHQVKHICLTSENDDEYVTKKSKSTGT